MYNEFGFRRAVMCVGVHFFRCPLEPLVGRLGPYYFAPEYKPAIGYVYTDYLGMYYIAFGTTLSALWVTINYTGIPMIICKRPIQDVTYFASRQACCKARLWTPFNWSTADHMNNVGQLYLDSCIYQQPLKVAGSRYKSQRRLQLYDSTSMRLQFDDIHYNRKPRPTTYLCVGCCTAA